MRIALVVPTCRPDSFRSFLEAWTPHRWWDDLVVVEDQSQCTEGLVPGGSYHCSWRTIDEHLTGGAGWIFSRRDSAIRCYGLYLAWTIGADWVVTLDDDCYPWLGHEDLATLHRSTLPRWASSVPGMRVRGLPYQQMGEVEPVISMGLWGGVPDLDAPTTLAAGCPRDWVPPAGRRVLPAHQLHPICGMNLAIRRDLIPAAYFPLQGEGSPYRRFDDIWAGLFLQRVARHLGKAIAAGEPFVRHARASDPMVNLVKEAPGIAAHERYWEVFDRLELTADDAASCMAELAEQLGTQEDQYLRRVGRALAVWARLFSG